MIGALFHRHGAWLRLSDATLVAWACRAAAVVALWQQRARERELLSLCDDRMLRDIGLSRLDVRRECGKPFWRG